MPSFRMVSAYANFKAFISLRNRSATGHCSRHLVSLFAYSTSALTFASLINVSTTFGTYRHLYAIPASLRSQLRHSQHALFTTSLFQTAALPRPLPPAPACHIPLPYHYPCMPKDPASNEGRDEKIRERRIRTAQSCGGLEEDTVLA